MASFLSAVVTTARSVGRTIAMVHRATIVRFVNARRRRKGLDELNPRQRRFIAIVTGAVVALIAIAVTSGGQPTTPRSVTTAAPRTDRIPSAAAGPGTSADRGTSAIPFETSTPAVEGEAVTVAKIVDGDTFDLTSGERVRVLGIDSCEAGTPGGRDATAAAEGLLSGSQVTITVQPGVDRDRSERLLRYVSFNGQDFGEHMVRHDHTGVYEGVNDASPEYVAKLYASDLMYAASPPAGRICGEDPPPAPNGDSYNPPNNSDDSSYAGRKAKGYVCRKTIFC